MFCLFEGVLDNLGRLSQQYGLSTKGANEVLLVIEAYKTLRDRAPYPASFMLAQLTGSYAFVLFDKSTNSLLVASDRRARCPSSGASPPMAASPSLMTLTCSKDRVANRLRLSHKVM